MEYQAGYAVFMKGAELNDETIAKLTSVIGKIDYYDVEDNYVSVKNYKEYRVEAREKGIWVIKLLSNDHYELEFQMDLEKLSKDIKKFAESLSTTEKKSRVFSYGWYNGSDSPYCFWK